MIQGVRVQKQGPNIQPSTIRSLHIIQPFPQSNSPPLKQRSSTTTTKATTTTIATATTTTTAITENIAAIPTSKNKYLKLGLKNITGTDCFINSIIKLFLYCTFLKGHFDVYDIEQIDDGGTGISGINEIKSNSVDNIITNEIQQLFKDYYTNRSKLPESHLKLLNLIYENYWGIVRGSQHDAFSVYQNLYNSLVMATRYGSDIKFSSVCQEYPYNLESNSQPLLNNARDFKIAENDRQYSPISNNFEKIVSTQIAHSNGLLISKTLTNDCCDTLDIPNRVNLVILVSRWRFIKKSVFINKFASVNQLVALLSSKYKELSISVDQCVVADSVGNILDESIEIVKFKNSFSNRISEKYFNHSRISTKKYFIVVSNLKDVDIQSNQIKLSSFINFDKRIEQESFCSVECINLDIINRNNSNSSSNNSINSINSNNSIYNNNSIVSGDRVVGNQEFQVEDKITIEDCINSKYNIPLQISECIECNNNYAAIQGDCNHSTQKFCYKTEKIIIESETLVLSLKRYYSNTNLEKDSFKCEQYVEFPDQISVLVNGRYIKYNLRVLVHHLGNKLSSGHYISFTLDNNNNWLKHNDSIVTESSKSEADTNDIYISVYEKSKTQDKDSTTLTDLENIGITLNSPIQVSYHSAYLNIINNRDQNKPKIKNNSNNNNDNNYSKDSNNIKINSNNNNNNNIFTNSNNSYSIYKPYTGDPNYIKDIINLKIINSNLNSNNLIK